MAIGISLPPRQVAQTRLQLRTAETAFGGHPQKLKAGILRIVSITRVVWRRMMNAVRNVLRHQERVKQRQRAQFIAFEHQFEGLVDLLCASAREGVLKKRECEYRQRRDWMMVHYPPIARHLQSYWTATQPQPMDPIQALFCSARLEETINVESTIEDITRARFALEAYGTSIDAYSN